MRMRLRIPGRSTIELMIILSGSIFVCETVINHALPRLLNFSGWLSDIADASVLIFVIFPLLYFFSFHPLKKLQSVLRESEELFRSTFDRAVVGIAHVSLEGNFLYINDRWCTIVGYTRDDLMMKSFEDLAYPDDRYENTAFLKSLLANENQAYSAEQRFSRKDGTVVWITLKVSLLREAAGAPKHYVAIIEDISERRRVEQERQAMYEIVEGVTTTANLDELLKLIQQSLGNVLYAENCFVALYDQNTGLFSFPYFVDKFDSAPPSATLAKSCTSYVFRSGKPMLIQKNFFNQLLEHNEVELIGSPSPSWIGVPLQTPSRTIGVLVLQHYEQENIYTEQDLKFLSSIGSQVAFAIERKRAEKELRESEKQSRRLAAIVESSDDIIISKTLDGIITSWNTGAENIYGYNESEMIGKPISILLPPERSDETANILEQIKTGLRLVHYETVRQRKDGRRIDVSLTVSPIKDKEGKIIAASTIGRDITEHKRAELLLRQSEEKFKTAFLTSPDSININRLEDGMYISINQGFTRTTGYTEEDVIGKTSLELNIWDNAEDRKKLVEGLREHGRMENLEAVFRKKDGTTLLGLMSAAIIQVDGVPYNLSITRDITELRLAEAKKMDLERRLLQAQKLESIGTLAGGIAHDFNNVLGGIMGYTEMSLRCTEKDSKLEKNLFKILKATDRAKHLIEQILTFSRKTTPQKSIISVRPIIKEALDLLRASIPSSVIIESDLDKNTKPVLADPTKIHEVLLNLATNAVHAMNRKGMMTIRLYAACLDRVVIGHAGEIAPGEYTVIEVADTGCGMEATTLSRAFEPFFTTKAVGEGTGMGLSVVLGVLQSLGGDIQVESKVGKGTTFRLYLPVAEESVFGTMNDNALLQLSGTEQILFVDDEQMLVEMAKDILTPLGYTVIGISDSRDALQFIKENGNDIDILITDQTMPGMTGIELTKEVLKIRKGLPILLCTGFSNELNPERAAAIGINEILMKPFRADEIGKSIRNIFDNKK